MSAPFGTMVKVNGQWRSRTLGTQPTDKRTGALWQRTVGGLQRIDSLNKALRVNAATPDPAARQAAVKREASWLAGMASEHTALTKQVADERKSLLNKATDFSKGSFTGSQLRAEARKHLAALPVREKMRAVESSRSMASALFEQDGNGNFFPELSGVSRDTFDVMLKGHLARQYPEEVAALEASEEGLSQVATALATAHALVDSEMTASGASTPSDAAKPAPAWFAPAE